MLQDSLSSFSFSNADDFGTWQEAQLVPSVSSVEQFCETGIGKEGGATSLCVMDRGMALHLTGFQVKLRKDSQLFFPKCGADVCHSGVCYRMGGLVWKGS